MHRLKHAAIALSVFILSGLAPVAAGQAPASVQVKDAQVRTGPSFMGKIITSLPYGTAVRVLTESGGWAHVQLSDGATGWVHGSALTREKIRLVSGEDEVDRYATSDEIALAGKGFNAELEARYRDRNQSLDYAWIDRMEKDTVPPGDIDRFLREGGLAPEGGRQ